VLLLNCAVGEQYHRLLKEDGFSVEQLRHRVKDFALPGSYRTLVTKPADVTWEVLHYNDVTIPLTLSDVDSLQNKPKPQSVPGKDNIHPKHFLKPKLYDVGSKVSLSEPTFIREQLYGLLLSDPFLGMCTPAHWLQFCISDQNWIPG